MVIALFHAVSIEAGSLIAGLSTPVRYVERTGRPTVCGGIGRSMVYCIETGVGKVNAAISSSLALDKYRPDIVVSMGIGGAYPQSGLDVGSIAVAEHETYGDEGVILENDFLTLDKIGMPYYKIGDMELFNTFALDAKLTGQLYDVVSRSFKDTKAGGFITVSSCTGTRKRSDELTNRFNGICENMEGAAIAHVSTMYGVPAVEIRAISNIAADRDRDRWEIDKASQFVGRAAIMFIKSL